MNIEISRKEKEELRTFIDKWLDAWTGNRRDLLLDFYTEDVYYLDPANPGGLKGKEQLSGYLGKLLPKNPGWKWEAIEVIPTGKGCTIK